ncbi:energy-coupling factor transport system permease protein [Bacillus oleivorans]|uniref:Energy-coupling factor transport system permease protein n=1 Tax=Bacillus oleivorans TaxID=1448271 RepID=A0A285CL06_9BACI|nr:energy-coupling factor transporter transmembrane component T [Bacillus oleivorans]SNX68055.1 energy-coupling factor transport system permease protein [Bacillus oleivorans]
MFLKSLNPSLKAGTITFVIMMLAFVFDPITPLLLLIWTMGITILFGQVSLKKWLFYFSPFLILAFGFFWTTIVFSKESASTGTVPIFWLEVPIDTFIIAISLSLRVLCFSALSLLFIFTTKPTDFILSLMQQCKLPPKLAYGILAGFRFLPMLKEELFIIRSAHRVRGVNRAKSLKHYAENVKRYSIPLLASSIRKAERTAIAMESKGFTGEKGRTFYRTMRITRNDWLFVFIMIAYLIGCSLISWKLGFFQFYKGQL